MLAFGKLAQTHSDGAIDLSVGTPVDETPEFIQSALREGSNAPGYPLTAGSAALREALRQWAISTLDASGAFEVLPTIGSKELVAWLPTFLESKRVLIPEIAYPTYNVGALIAGAEVIPVSIDASTWPAGDLAWINTPSNPTGRTHSEFELRAAIEWSRSGGGILASDECYLEFGDSATPRSVMAYTDGDNRNILAVHSLSKRSSMAGYRAGFVLGDVALIERIREIRKHAGMIVPAPVQRAMAAALRDDRHVAEQRARYVARRSLLVPALRRAGFEVAATDAGLYIWCTRHETDMDSVQWFAERGILVTPGHFYGSTCSQYIRIALTATDSQVAQAAARISDLP